MDDNNYIHKSDICFRGSSPNSGVKMSSDHKYNSAEEVKCSNIYVHREDPCDRRWR